MNLSEEDIYKLISTVERVRLWIVENRSQSLSADHVMALNVDGAVLAEGLEGRSFFLDIEVTGETKEEAGLTLLIGEGERGMQIRSWNKPDGSGTIAIDVGGVEYTDWATEIVRSITR